MNESGNKPHTYFAPPERSSKEELEADINLISKNPVINGLLNLVSGFFAVLNAHRQVIIVNDSYLKFLGISDISQIIGLRPGETVSCIHADELEGGCGTSESCPTCGAAVAIMTCLRQGTSQEMLCAITTDRNEEKDDLFLRIRAHPLVIEETKMVMLFLQDITHQQKLEYLEKVFFHDVSNIVTGLMASSRQVRSDDNVKQQKALERIEVLSSRLAREIAMQKMLIQFDLHTYQPNLQTILVNQVFDDLNSAFNQHPACSGKTILFDKKCGQEAFVSDKPILIRVMSNMVLNALEASKPGEEIRIAADLNGSHIFFKVWNRLPIPQGISKRIFQRNFSTKAQNGRGLGTYSMKLFGEEILRGTVDFTSNESEGTEFWIRLNR